MDAADDRLHAAEVKMGVPDLPNNRRPTQKKARRIEVAPVSHKAVNPSAVKMAANLIVSGMSIADAASAMRNLGFTAREVSAVLPG